jgi:phosphomannomutase
VDEKGGIISATSSPPSSPRTYSKKSPAPRSSTARSAPRRCRSSCGARAATPSAPRRDIRSLNRRCASTDAAFGGEHSGHFYFRDNYFADSGIIALLTVAELVGRQGGPLSGLLAPIDPYVRSGETNSEVEDGDAVMKKVEQHYAERDSPNIDHLDGLTVDFGDWWFNLRPSNTEPLLRLNVEARDRETMEKERNELLDLIRS